MGSVKVLDLKVPSLALLQTTVLAPRGLITLPGVLN